jgi:hypothetical protein
MSFKHKVVLLVFLVCSQISSAVAGNYQDLLDGVDSVDEAVASIVEVMEKQG